MTMKNDSNFENLPPVLTVEELAEILRIGRNTAYNLVKEKKIKSIQCGRAIRIPRKAIEELIG